ncbi:MAG: BrnT family toxin [Defluviitaleaceae bacterium]|nr:BrnT family toxin [Defluviitaleaceae bacterium]
MLIFDEFFTWDDTKNRKNAIKHGVNFQEAASVFKDTSAVVLDDIEHSKDEDRFIIIGESKHERILMVCHCYRENDELIRIISARKADDEEKDIYENGGAYW